MKKLDNGYLVDDSEFFIIKVNQGNFETPKALEPDELVGEGEVEVEVDSFGNCAYQFLKDLELVEEVLPEFDSDIIFGIISENKAAVLNLLRDLGFEVDEFDLSGSQWNSGRFADSGGIWGYYARHEEGWLICATD